MVQAPAITIQQLLLAKIGKSSTWYFARFRNGEMKMKVGTTIVYLIRGTLFIASKLSSCL